MQRDMDLIREILLAISEREDLKAREIDIVGHDLPKVRRHIQMLHQAGYIDGTPFKERVLVRDLTMAGHDFAAAISRKSVWEEIKRRFSSRELSSIPLDVVKELGTRVTIEIVKQAF